VNENRPIGVSFVPLRVKADRFGRVKTKDCVAYDHWTPDKCEFLDGYALDMKECKDGDIILCPHCHKPVDFIGFLSSTVPRMNKLNAPKTDNPEKLPMS
jgi:hypothetical protein